MSNKMRNYVLLTLMVVLSMGFQSCSSNDNDAERRVEYTQIVEKKSSVDAMNELYVAADGEVESLARMLQTTPSVINRIRQGETAPTQDFEEKIKEVLVYYNLNDRSFSKLQSALDDEYGWYDSILNFPSHHPLWFWIGNALLIIISIAAGYFELLPISFFCGLITIGELIIGIIAWIAMLICSPGQMEDKYVDSINPVMEQML